MEITRVFSDADSGLKDMNPGQEKTIIGRKKAGSYTFTATDNAGNKKSCYVTVTSKLACPSGSKESESNTSICRSTSNPIAAKACTSGKYNKDNRKCETTEHKSTTTYSAAYSCPSGWTVKNKTSAASYEFYQWDCYKATSPVCEDGYIMYSGSCYKKVNKETVYHATYHY